MTGRGAQTDHHVDEGAIDGNTVGALWARVRRYWWLVLAVVWVAALAAVVATMRAPTTYVGHTSLIVSSNDRAPDQDAVLVQGYITLFNDGPYQRKLLDSAKVTGDVSLSAEAAATSPILVISATAPDPATAQRSAVAVADAFRDDINAVRTQSNQQQLVTLQDQLDTLLASNSPDAQTVITELQNRIDAIKADQVNMLQPLQSEGGVSVQQSSLFGNLLPAVAGGLLIGVLAALALARASRRLLSKQDVADKVGLRTLVELPRPRGREGRVRLERRLGQLANIVRARLTGPGVVAVAQPEEGVAASVVARELAREWARQGYPTVLVSTGAGGILDDAEATPPRVRSGRLQGVSLLQLAPRPADDAPVLSVSTMSELLEQETLAGQYVVIEAPAVVQSAAAQAVCHAADQTILVVDTQVSRVPALREAVSVLRQMGASVMGAVVASVSDDRSKARERRPFATDDRSPANSSDLGAATEHAGSARVNGAGPVHGAAPVDDASSVNGSPRQGAETGR